MDRNYDFVTFNSKKSFLKESPRVSNFGGIIKNAAVFIEKTFKDSKRVKINRNYI